LDIITSVPGGIHTAFATIALISGAVVLLRRKGTRFHRQAGYLYFASMWGLVLAGIPMAHNGISAFHWLSAVSAASISLGLLAVLGAKAAPDPAKRAGRLYAHYKFMAWSYAGLVAAGASQISARVALSNGGTIGEFWWAVAGGSAAVIAAAIVLIRLYDRRAGELYGASPNARSV
jgi:uncharacterized membrane protein